MTDGSNLAKSGRFRRGPAVRLGVLVEVLPVAVAGDDDDTENVRHFVAKRKKKEEKEKVEPSEDEGELWDPGEPVPDF